MLASRLGASLRALSPCVSSAVLSSLGGATLGQLGSVARIHDYAAGRKDGPPAFVFDIDGVLVRGEHVLPSAKKALAKLYTQDRERAQYPVAFLTNGGGVSEERKAEQLSEWLDVYVDPSQVVLSHTPFKQLVPELRYKPVLISGRGHVVDLAKRYGFTKTITCKQLARILPTSVPFAHNADQLRHPHGEGSQPHYVRWDHTIGTEADPIAAILIFHDPSDWYQELQIMMDVLTSRGVPGRRHPPVHAPHVQVFFSNPDLLWSNEFPTPRFGQGAFAVCLEALHEKMTGHPLHAKRVFGKPNPEPYTLIEELLLQQARELGLAGAPAAGSSPASEGLPFSSIYAVGDNPAADVRGATRAGHPWVSVLVKTGVFDGTLYANCPNDPAHMVVDDVEAAVDAALHRHRSARWHSMR